MDRELKVNFFFGDSRPGSIKPLDVKALSNFKGFFHNISLGPAYWQTGALKLLKSDYTDIITTADHYCISTWLMLLLSPLYKNKKLYLWTHGAYGSEHGLKKWLTIWKMKRADGIFLYGNYAKTILIQWGIPQKKMHIIYNSLAYDEQRKMRNELRVSSLYNSHFHNSNPNIIFIGRLTKVKKLHFIIEAVNILKKSNINVNITFIGDGTEKDFLQTLAENNNLTENVWFYGACYDERKIADFLYNADLCVSPGDVGLTAMHAMAFGCPVISHDNFKHQMPEFEAIVGNKTGLFFKENDIESLASSIKKWLNIDMDRDSIRKNCYEIIDNKYNPHKQVDLLRKIIYI